MNHTEPPTNSAYAASAQQFPTDDQTILIEALNNLQIKEYRRPVTHNFTETDKVRLPHI